MSDAEGRDGDQDLDGEESEDRNVGDIRVGVEDRAGDTGGNEGESWGDWRG